MPRSTSPARANGEVTVASPADLPRLLNRAELLIRASDSLRDLVASDIDSGTVGNRFEHPFASFAGRIEREATKAGRAYKAAKKAADQAASQPNLTPA